MNSSLLLRFSCCYTVARSLPNLRAHGVAALIYFDAWKEEKGGPGSFLHELVRYHTYSTLCKAKAPRDASKPKWKEELAEDEESHEAVTAEDMEEWRQREEAERKVREAKEAEEAKKRGEAEKAAAAAAEAERLKDQNDSRSSRSSSSGPSRSRSRRRRRSSSSSRSVSRSRRKTGWDVADSNLLAQAQGLAGLEFNAKALENKPQVIPPPPPPAIPRVPSSDASPQSAVLRPSAALATQVPPAPHRAEPFNQCTQLPPPPPPPSHVNGAMLNAPLHGQAWEQVPMNHQDISHLQQSQAQFSAPSHPRNIMSQQWPPNMSWQPHMDPSQAQWGQAAPMWDPFHSWQVRAPPSMLGPSMTTPERCNEEERFTGRVKRFQEAPGGGYGFIDCDEAKVRFTRDIYIHRNQMVGLQIGDEVSFTITLNNKGEPQARNVMKREEALLLRAGHVHGMVPGPDVPAATSNLMDEHQARQFQAALRGSVD